MDFNTVKETFTNAKLAHFHNTLPKAENYPTVLEPYMKASDCQQALDVISTWDGYLPTPLHRLEQLASDIDVSAIYYKDEGLRFGLESFKALGGAYAVIRLLKREIEKTIGHDINFSDIASEQYKDIVKNINVVTATDGNHGRSVAWGAQQFGCPCYIYMHKDVSEGRADAVRKYGATVIRVNGNYDASVDKAKTDAAENDYFVVSDTSYEGYIDMPRHVMEGYTVMTSEVYQQIAANDDMQVPTHVFVQGGVGGLAGAVCAHLWMLYGEERPRFIVAEPVLADCLYQSAKNGKVTMVDIPGLSCGEVSMVAWPILQADASDFLTMSDELVAPVMQLLANASTPIVSGESAVAGLSVAIAARFKPELSKALGLDENSRILIMGTEGATDPEIYESLVGRSATEIKTEVMA